MATSSKSDTAQFIEKLSRKTGQVLRQHQIDGVEFMKECWKNGYGCILADEMGLGKTCQAITILSYLLHKNSDNDKKFLIVCPLSVLDHWKNEPEKFGDGLEIIVYRGDKEEREELREQIMRRKVQWNTILTTYELLMNDSEFFSRHKWTAVVIDEAHRLKNMDSVLHGIIADEIKYKWILLLTGTPVQNNLGELYSLLSLCHSDEFPPERMQRFVDRFSDSKNDKAMNKLRQVMKRYVLRRTKDVACADLPSKSEVILFHNLADMQKELYKAILMKNYDIFEQGAAENNKRRMMNTLVQLRKCVGHPYLFEGVEPEPFEEGEHLIKASGKLLILDILLAFLKKRGHRVLLFSQMTRMLDIMQDYLSYRKYSYERLDGSVRGEERFAAVQRFTTTETFCFLLSTRAGGVGLNLMAADTVIFLDSDFNPQNDLQAAARAHRLGQTRHVKIIRLVGRQTVEEIILARASAKLKFANTVLYEQSDDFAKVLSAAEISEILMYGLSEMGKKKAASDVNDADLEKLLGKSKDGQWIAAEETEGKDWIDELEMKDMYTFEGKDYREESKQADRDAFAELKRVAETKEVIAGDEKKRRALGGVSAETKQKRTLTEEELEELRAKRREAAERRKLVAEENRATKEEERKQRLAQLWKETGYQSTNLPESVEAENTEPNNAAAVDLDQEDSAEDDSESAQRDPFFTIGDVTKPDLRPEHKTSDVVIVHCVDNSGVWGKGGVFTALSALSSDIESHYEVAKEMKDLNLGDVHLVEVKGHHSDQHRTIVALIVAQHHRKRNEIISDALAEGLKRIGIYASKNRCTVHMPRIGYGSASFNWYGTERMIRKLLCQRGVPTYIYYYPRNQKRGKRQLAVDESGSDDGDATVDKRATERDSDRESASSKRSDETSDQPATKPKRPKLEVSEPNANVGDRHDSRGELPYLPSLFDGFTFCFSPSISGEDARRFRRFVIAYGGHVTDKKENEDMTHIVAQDGQEEDEGVKDSGKPVVMRSWLEKCIKEKKLLPLS